MVKTCEEEGRREHVGPTKKNGSNTKPERKTANQVERLWKVRGVCLEDVVDRTQWKRDIRNYSVDSR